MKRSILAALQQKSVASIANKLGVEISVSQRGDTSHKHLRILQAIDASIGETHSSVGFTLDEILAIDGLSVKSKRILAEALS